MKGVIEETRSDTTAEDVELKRAEQAEPDCDLAEEWSTHNMEQPLIPNDNYEQLIEFILENRQKGIGAPNNFSEEFEAELQYNSFVQYLEEGNPPNLGHAVMRAAAYTVYKFGAELFGVSDVSSLALLYYHNYLTRRDLYYTGVYHRDNWKQLKILNDHIVKGAEL